MSDTELEKIAQERDQAEKEYLAKHYIERKRRWKKP